MPDFSIRSDSVNVEEIMAHIRARVREKRGVDYTEQEIRELATARLEKFLDPTKVRSDLLEQYRQLQQRQTNADAEIDEESLFGSPRPWLRTLRRWLRPILKLFLNPVTLMRASRVNVRHAELFFELVHNLVVETTRLGIEVKNLTMKVESMQSRLDFDERRARALEGAVQYKPAAPAAEPSGQGTGGSADEESESGPSAAKSRRRRRRRGRRGGGPRSAGEETAAGGDSGLEAGDEGAEDTPTPATPEREAAESARAHETESTLPPAGTLTGAPEQPQAARSDAASVATERPVEERPRPEDGGSEQPGR